MTPGAQAMLLSPVTLGWPLLLVAIVWAVRETRAAKPASSPGWNWWLLAAGVTLCFRIPLLGMQHQLNPDESQLIAGAITLRHDPVFWRSVDGGTAGPFDFYILLPAAWTTGFASYAVARLIAWFTAFGAILFAGEALALTAGAALARVAVLPALAALAFTTNPELLHYSTELTPALLLAAAGYVAVKHGLAPAHWRLWLIALLLGAVPWAKLQATPLAAALWIVVVAREIQARRPRSLLPLLVGALLPTLACVGVALVTGQFEHLYVPYVLNNFAYVGAPHFSWIEVAAGQWQNALSDGYLGFWLAGTALCLLPLGLWQLRSATPAARRQVLVALGLLAIGVFCALAPRRPSAHHLQLLPLPWLWLTGSVLALAWNSINTPQRRLVCALVFLACALGPQLAWKVGGTDPFATINAAGVNPARRELTALVRTFSHPGEPLAIWGWRCSLYVEAGRPQATRQAQTEAQIYAGPLQAYFLRRYLEDFQASRAPVFADAVGPGAFAFDNRDRAHECFPPLRAWVQAHYTQVAELDGTRLYVRNDRLPARPPASP